MNRDLEFLAMYERSIDDVYRYASRLTGGARVETEDLVQDTFTSVLQRLQRGDEVELGTGYLVVVCRNRFLDQLRSGRRRRAREEGADNASHNTVRRVEPDPPDPTTTAALALLHADQRAALVLRYVDDLSVPDVARLLGRSVHATESLLARARTAMRTELSKGATS